MFRLLLAAFLLMLPLSAGAQPTSTAIQVEHPWARASMSRTGVVYLTIVNTGSTDDRLLGATTPAADEAQLHFNIDDHGIMKMRPLSAIDVKAGDKAVLKPTGMHLMLVGLKQALKAGDSFPLTLTFEKAGNITVTVEVMKAGSMGDMDHMKM